MTSTQTQATVRVGRAVQFAGPNKPLSVVQQTTELTRADQVLLKVKACGVCHSDSFPESGMFPGQIYPIIPGHEIVGIVEEVGSSAKRFKKGDRVAVGWHGGHCGECDRCRRGDFIACIKLQTPGINLQGGYSEYACFAEAVCAAVPEELSDAEAAPLVCAGVTTFNSLRNSGATAGDTVAILGIGGLGHLGVQFASKMGFRTVAIARGDEKASFAKELGAHHYINSQKGNVTEELNKLGGAKVVLATVTDTTAMNPVIGGLAVDGCLLIVGAGFDPLDVRPVQLLGNRLSVKGWPSGRAVDSEDCMKFAALTGIRPLIERFPLDRAEDAYKLMMSGKARFRAVLQTGA
jgi:D-arabinose 1-dehydrogenase-like Zn-dependent alcohol dehydrogenase